MSFKLYSLLNIYITIRKNLMGAIIAFFASLAESAEPKKSKDAHVINIANLNYCGIMKSPFQFYSGKYQQALESLSKHFSHLRKLYIPDQKGKEFNWQFAKLDKKIKERYCPFYNINCGIENGKFISQKRYTELWEINYKEQEILTQCKFSEEQKKEAFTFDLLAFHTLLFHLFKILDIDQAVHYSVDEYYKTYIPFFNQSFLDQKKKLVQFKKGLGENLADVVFVQEPDQLLIDDLQQFQNHYFISISPDKDTLIFAKKDRFRAQYDNQQLLARLTPEEQALLNWNKHTSIMFLDDYMLISGHLNSKKAENQANVKDLVTIMPIIIKKYPEFEIICGMDANSFIAPFDQRIHMFPYSQNQFTSIKKRTSMQVQSQKAEKLIQQLKDAIMTTLPFRFKQVLTISSLEPSEKDYLPLDEHPFDHFLIFVVVEEKRKGNEKKQ